MKVQLISAALALVSAATLSFQDQTPEPGETPDKPLAVGDEAPHFILNDHKGQLANQSTETEGWTLIAFYPKALTGG